MANIILNPVDQLILIDGQTAYGINFSGIDPTIASVQWFDVTGFICFEGDLVAGTHPPNQTISDLTQFQSYITQAENIIFAANNPVTYWALEDNTIYDEGVYNAGDPLEIGTYPPPTAPPPGFTDIQPIGSSAAYTTWQLDTDTNTWIASSYPITLDLAGAKDYLTKLVQANASALINNQLSSYDAAQIAVAADPELLEPRYKAINLYPTIGDYRAAVAVETAPLFADITAATAKNQLYLFDPTVNEPPTYTP